MHPSMDEPLFAQRAHAILAALMGREEDAEVRILFLIVGSPATSWVYRFRKA